MLTATPLRSNFAIHERESGRWMDFRMSFEVQNPVQVRKEFPPKGEMYIGGFGQEISKRLTSNKAASCEDDCSK